MDSKPAKPNKYVTEFDDDLAGKTFDFVMDDGYEYVAFFMTGEIVQWARRDEPFRWEKYHCLRNDETTFFVVMELFDAPVRTCRTLVIDTAQRLVTMHVARQGVVPGRPRLVRTEFIFGAIQEPGRELPFIRHAYTDDLLGKKITWHYSSGFVNTHIYSHSHYYRIRPLQQGVRVADVPDAVADEAEKQQAEQKEEWLYEEPVTIVKIKDGCYLCSGIEENMNRVNNMTGGNNLVYLTNMEAGIDVGRTFCLNALQQPESGLFRTHGEYVVEDIPVEHLPSPYRVN